VKRIRTTKNEQNKKAQTVVDWDEKSPQPIGLDEGAFWSLDDKVKTREEAGQDDREEILEIAPEDLEEGPVGEEDDDEITIEPEDVEAFEEPEGYPDFSSVFMALRWAKNMGEVVRIHYTCRSGRPVVRDVEPHGDFWARTTKRRIVVTYDQTVEGIKSFIVSGITELQFKGEQFSKRFNFSQERRNYTTRLRRKRNKRKGLLSSIGADMENLVSKMVKAAIKLEALGLNSQASEIDSIAKAFLDIKTAQYVGGQGYCIRNKRSWDNCYRQKRNESMGAQESWDACNKEYQESINNDESSWNKYAGSTETIKTASAVDEEERKIFHTAFTQKLEEGNDVGFAVYSSMLARARHLYEAQVDQATNLLKTAHAIKEAGHNDLAQEISAIAMEMVKTAGLRDMLTRWWGNTNQIQNVIQESMDILGRSQATLGAYENWNPQQNKIQQKDMNSIKAAFGQAHRELTELRSSLGEFYDNNAEKGTLTFFNVIDSKINTQLPIIVKEIDNAKRLLLEAYKSPVPPWQNARIGAQILQNTSQAVLQAANLVKSVKQDAQQEEQDVTEEASQQQPQNEGPDAADQLEELVRRPAEVPQPEEAPAQEEVAQEEATQGVREKMYQKSLNILQTGSPEQKAMELIRMEQNPLFVSVIGKPQGTINLGTEAETGYNYLRKHAEQPQQTDVFAQLQTAYNAAIKDTEVQAAMTNIKKSQEFGYLNQILPEQNIFDELMSLIPSKMDTHLHGLVAQGGSEQVVAIIKELQTTFNIPGKKINTQSQRDIFRSAATGVTTETTETTVEEGPEIISPMSKIFHSMPFNQLLNIMKLIFNSAQKPDQVKQVQQAVISGIRKFKVLDAGKMHNTSPANKVSPEKPKPEPGSKPWGDRGLNFRRRKK